MHPGQRNSLDALCKRYSVDNSHRELHGALLDAQILLDVYLAMTGGQTALMLGEVTEIHVSVSLRAGRRVARPRGVLRVVRASDDELVAHERMLAGHRQDQRRQDGVEERNDAALQLRASARSLRSGIAMHARAGFRSQLPRPRARLVQADDRRASWSSIRW